MNNGDHSQPNWQVHAAWSKIPPNSSKPSRLEASDAQKSMNTAGLGSRIAITGSCVNVMISLVLNLLCTEKY